ncbi:DnaJ domain-containing protein [Apiospora arundinis]|uniref:DnaJ domain-containing protein n=1 Tax=Apiospora arundinis TaxID=335852 RepID=A0ABR2I0A2_9PEZI
MDDNTQSGGTSAADSSRPGVLPAQERIDLEEMKAEAAILAENIAAVDQKWKLIIGELLYYNERSPQHLRDKLQEDWAGLPLHRLATLESKEQLEIIVRFGVPAIKFVRAVRAHLRAQEEEEEENQEKRGTDSDPRDDDDESPEPPRVPKRRFSSWLMYMCRWRFVAEVMFLLFIAALLGTLFHQLFLRPSDYASRQQRYRPWGDGDGNRATPPPFQHIFSSRPSRPPPPPNYYAILNIDPDATDRTIRAAYRRQSRLHHPDKIHASNASKPSDGGGGNGGWGENRTAEERMRLISAAYHTLSGGEDRCAYDYHEYPRSEGARSGLNSAARLRKYYACQREVRMRLFTKANDKGDDDRSGDSVHNKKEGVKRPVNKRNEESMEQKVRKAEVKKTEVKKANVKKDDVKKKQEQDRKGGTAAAKQETALGEQTDPAWQRYLRLAEKAAEGTGEAYHTLCYGDAVARTGLFALQQAIAWKFGVEVPDLCLGGG